MARWSRLFDGKPESVGLARKFARLVLVDHVLADTVELVVSELATNALEHTSSGDLDGLFVVQLEVFPDRVEVAVIDMGADSRPVLVGDDPANVTALSGRGLHIVRALSKEWGCERVRVGLRVWADIACEA
ncbi:Anti-sigma regulatory factor (Ser/Thr protein kinase) [Thermomonospora echinospora]|uniref:Anti-sigma regulatory factor (Ser/Thr protein kinase) n=1 Tax=Thermomonospora echinospora TaxID=1992 RepID=A0A1H6DWY6_9ACTN|nr:ATP-binding protein [Thermomonospora echinospora]SEG89847.1 Anti-sigma regulatory factor (Ser/Thr protein kinase) [Thermomonospora echinospora]